MITECFPALTLFLLPPLVLHGGSGIPDDMIRRSIALGIRKINVATEIRKCASLTYNPHSQTEKVKVTLKNK